MFKELNSLKSKNNISKNDLMGILHEIAKTISVEDLMIATAILREDGKYIQAKYREEYLEIYIKHFIMRIKDVREDKTDYSKETLKKNEFSEAVELLNSQFHDEQLYMKEMGKFPTIYTIISLYTTFILNESIHPIGTPFPGGSKVIYENETYLCPVKDIQSENPNAVCKICIAKQLEF